MTDLSALLVIVRVRQNALQGLHCQSASFLHRDTQVPHREHPLPVSGVEPEFHLGFDFLLVSHLGVMDERSSTSIRGLVSGCGILETLDDSGLAAAVVSDDHGYWGKELDDGDLFIVERPDAPNRELVQRSHRWSGRRGRGHFAVETEVNEVSHVRVDMISHRASGGATNATSRAAEDIPHHLHHERHRYSRYPQTC